MCQRRYERSVNKTREDEQTAEGRQFSNLQNSSNELLAPLELTHHRMHESLVDFEPDDDDGWIGLSLALALA